ncbi:MAG: hypothetical protein ACE5D6_00985 [Candidatus Zixiibacteriota bacterium]
MRFCRFFVFAFLFLFFNNSVEGFTTRSKTITYANFNYIKYIASSISHVYFATTNGIIRFNKLDNRWEEPLTDSEDIDHQDIDRIWVDNFDEKIYIRSSSDLYEFDSLFNRWYPIDEIPRLDNSYIHINPPQIMYPPAGYNFSSEGYIIDQYGRNYYINDMIDDRSGNYWIGTWGLGPALAGSVSHILELIPYGLIQNRVNTIYNDNGMLWVSGATYTSFRSGVTVFNQEENSFTYFESGMRNDFPVADINCIEGDDHYIYLGTSLGLLFLNRETNEIEKTITDRTGLPDNEVLSLKTVGDSVFIGTAGGLCLINEAEDSVQILIPQQFYNIEIHDFETTDSTLWIATAIGAFQLHRRTGKLQQFRDPHLIVFSHAYNIELYNNDIWFASDEGIVRLNLISGETQAFVSISRNVRSRPLAVNDEIAVVASERGMTIYFLGDKDHPFEREFTTDDGLPSDNIYCLLIDGDFIWIGSDKGLTRFLWNDPDRID